MQRGVIVYFVLFVVIAIVAAYLFLSRGVSGTKTTTTTTVGGGNTSTATTSVAPNTSTTNTTTQSTTSIIYAGCVSKNATAQIPDGNFSTGTYAGWNATGPGFGTAPFNISLANQDGAYYAAPWSGYNGNYMATNYRIGVALQTGNLTSNTFVASQLYLNFKIISSQSAQLYLQILANGKPAITDHYNTYVSPPGNTHPQSMFVNASIPLGQLLCQSISIRLVTNVVGKSSQGVNYIAAGDFYMGKTPAMNLTQPVNQTFS